MVHVITDNNGQNDVHVDNTFVESYHVVRTVYDHLDELLNYQNIFNIPNDPDVNSLTQFQALFDYLNEKNIPFKGKPGIYKLSGTGDITISVDCDFSNMIFKVGSWNGKFYFLRKKQVVIHNSSSEPVTALMASTNLKKGTSYIDTWHDLTYLNNSYIRINTDQSFFQYRDIHYTRFDLNHLWSKGFLNSALKYPLTDVNVTSIEVYPLEDKWSYVKGLVIDVERNYTKSNFIYVKTSLIDIQAHFIIDPIYSPPSMLPQLAFISDSAYVKAKFTFQRSLLSGILVAYCVGGSRNYDVQLELQGDGDGWGMNAFNQTQRMTIQNSNISRMDFHSPFLEYLKIKNTTLGDYGCTINGLGDVYIDDVTINSRNGPNMDRNVVPSLILCRGDADNGSVDGDLYINNLTVNVMDSYFFLFWNQATTEATLENGNVNTIYIIAKGSNCPITHRFFKNIYVNGVKSVNEENFNFDVIPTRIAKYQTDPNTNTVHNPVRLLDVRVRVPETVQLNNIKTQLRVYCDFNDLLPGSTLRDYNFDLSIENSYLKTLELTETTNNFKTHLKLDNVLPYKSSDGLSININSNIDGSINNSLLSDIDFTGLNTNGNYVNLSFYSTKFKKASGDFFTNKNQNMLLKFLYCSFYNSTESFLNNVVTTDYSKFIETDFFLNNVPYIPFNQLEKNQFNISYLDQKEIISQSTVAHSFTSHNVWQDTNVLLEFYPSKSGMIGIEVMFNNGTTAGNICGQVLIYRSNDDGATYVLYKTVFMGTVPANIKEVMRFSSQQYITRASFKKYKLVLQLRYFSTTTPSLPISQGESAITNIEKYLKVVYV